MFGPKHYVPILKWKRAEQSALQALNVKDKQRMTPLIQFVMPKAKSADNPEKQFQSVISSFKEKIPQLAQQILKAWGPTPIFVDFSLLYTTGLKVECLKSLTASGHALGMRLIPVLNLNDDAELKKAVYSAAKNYPRGICLRLVPHDLSDTAKLNKAIQVVLSESKLTEADVDLLVDTKEIGANGAYQAYVNASQRIQNLPKWRTFIFASGAFPADLSDCKIDEENFIPRFDLENWVGQLNEKNVLRKPTFADYTIQHPIYKESSQFFHPTASIRYALAGAWYIMKGKKQKFEMYLAHAKLLADDHDKFYGGGFSFGDKFIAEKAKHYPVYMKDPKVKGTGSTEGWLTAGINHHLVLTAHQIANLP
ncbi:MAG TPA: hypothetical protein VGR84_10855 [Candidatus Acidoferrales bacterium]|nr:hypothetical protein [Candidatus Acidoferrales bacterium]